MDGEARILGYTWRENHLCKWRRLQSELDLTNDNEVVVFLLERHRTLKGMYNVQHGTSDR